MGPQIKNVPKNEFGFCVRCEEIIKWETRKQEQLKTKR